jgi:hypothetical protein
MSLQHVAKVGFFTVAPGGAGQGTPRLPASSERRAVSIPRQAIDPK